MMDYERGLERLVQQAQGTSWFQECALYEARLRENLSEERLYGATEQTRSNKAQILEQLIRLAHKHLNVNFVDLCVKKHNSNQHLETTYSLPLLAQQDKSNTPVQITPVSLPISEDVRTSSPLKVFVGYSQKDRHYLEELRSHLTNDIRAGKIECWDDIEINPTDFWREEVTKTLMFVNTSILLVSSNFLASDFIANNALPYLLTSAKSGKVTILSVIVRPCRFEDTDLAQFEAVNFERPLSVMTPSERDKIWIKVAEYIKHTS